LRHHPAVTAASGGWRAVIIKSRAAFSTRLQHSAEPVRSHSAALQQSYLPQLQQQRADRVK
jgi:hypothetical protein